VICHTATSVDLQLWSFVVASTVRDEQSSWRRFIIHATRAEHHYARVEGNRTTPNESFVETPIEEDRMLWGRSPKPWLAQRQNSGFNSPDKRIENLIVT